MLGRLHCVPNTKKPTGLCCSYDLDLDQRLSEETTVLVESYTVSGLQ